VENFQFPALGSSCYSLPCGTQPNSFNYTAISSQPPLQSSTELPAVNWQLKTELVTVKIKVMLRTTVSWPACLDVKHPFGTLGQIYFFWQLRVCWCGAPSLTRGRVWLLHYNIFTLYMLLHEWIYTIFWSGQLNFKITLRRGPHRRRRSYIVASVFVSAGTCLPSRCSETAVCLFACCIETAVLVVCFGVFA
jgi:hypothetical protein